MLVLYKSALRACPCCVQQTDRRYTPQPGTRLADTYFITRQSVCIISGLLTAGSLGMTHNAIATSLTVQSSGHACYTNSTNSYLFQGLVDWHRSDWDGGVPYDPLAGLPDVRSSGQVHKSISTPEGGPLQLLHLRLVTAYNVRVSDVAVDLHL